MEASNGSSDDNSQNKKKYFHLVEINKKLSDTYRARKRINKLFNIYSKNLNELNEMSKEIRPEAVNKTKFNIKIMRLMKQSGYLNEKSKNSFIKDKSTLSEILKNMGKKVIKELFLQDHAEFLTKTNFRRYIEVKVKSFLGKDFLDFECASQIHLFEKMKKSLFINPLLNISNKIIEGVKQNEEFIDKPHSPELDGPLSTDRKINNESNVTSHSKSKNKEKKSNSKANAKNEIVENNDKAKLGSNSLINSVHDDILNIIINNKNENTDEDEKKEKIFYLVQSYKEFYPNISADKMILIVNDVEKELNGLSENKNIFQIVEEKLNLLEN